MSGRGARLQRLLAIRTLAEDLDRSALKAALAATAEVENALTALDHALVESKATAQAALSQGDRGEWMMADVQSEVAGWNRRKLKSLLVARAEVAAEAMERFLNSRIEQEQVKQLVKEARQTTELEQVRRAQIAADDWYLGRRDTERL